MSLARIIAYAAYQLAQHKIPAYRTSLQKLIYFVLPENRDDYYRPYYYGPFSDQVQQTVHALVQSRFFAEVAGRGYTLGTAQFATQGLNLATMLSGQPVERRIQGVADFLKQNQITAANDISDLAKVHYLSVRIQKQAGADLVPFIKNTAKYLGWSSVANMQDSKVDDLYTMARQIENIVA